MKVSIIIPTYNRPELLVQCLESCLRQSAPAHEIIIGDDSTNTDTEKIVRDIEKEAKIPIRYFHNPKPLGQGCNVHQLISLVSCEYLCLIHDDDYLSHDAIERLSLPFEDPNVMIAYGKQKIVKEDGEIDEQASEDLNKVYCRTAKNQGVQKDLLIAAIQQQIPNNGFIVESKNAKYIGYKIPQDIFGDACDFGFAVLLAEANSNRKAFFINAYTAFYRLSKTSIQRSKSSNNAAYRAFRYVYKFPKKIRNIKEIRKWLTSKSPIAIGNALSLNHLTEARKWLFSPYHIQYLLTPGGLNRTLKVFLASIR